MLYFNRGNCNYLKEEAMRFLYRKSAFTLIEVITVIAIIIILIGLLSPALRRAREQAIIEKARAMVGSLEVALSMYYMDYGAYPAEVGGSNNFANTLGTKSGLYGPYIEFKGGEYSGNAAIDPWENAYRFDKTSPPNNTASFDLWSAGPDGTSGNSDDITNW